MIEKSSLESAIAQINRRHTELRTAFFAASDRFIKVDSRPRFDPQIHTPDAKNSEKTIKNWFYWFLEAFFFLIRFLKF